MHVRKPSQLINAMRKSGWDFLSWFDTPAFSSALPYFQPLSSLHFPEKPSRAKISLHEVFVINTSSNNPETQQRAIISSIIYYVLRRESTANTPQNAGVTLDANHFLQIARLPYARPLFPLHPWPSRILKGALLPSSSLDNNTARWRGKLRNFLARDECVKY